MRTISRYGYDRIKKKKKKKTVMGLGFEYEYISYSDPVFVGCD